MANDKIKMTVHIGRETFAELGRQAERLNLHICTLVDSLLAEGMARGLYPAPGNKPRCGRPSRMRAAGKAQGQAKNA